MGPKRNIRWMMLGMTYAVALVLGVSTLVKSWNSRAVNETQQEKARIQQRERDRSWQEQLQQEQKNAVLQNVIRRESRSINPAVARQIADATLRAARTTKAEPTLILAIIEVESSYKPYAVSEHGAVGLMQVMPKYHARVLGSNPFDVHGNVMAGAKILASYRKGATLHHALARYGGNAQYPDKVFLAKNRIERLMQARKPNNY